MGSEGSGVGASVGACEGEAVGCSAVGVFVGEADGSFVGACEGAYVGGCTRRTCPRARQRGNKTFGQTTPALNVRKQ